MKIKGNNKKTRCLHLKCLSADLNLDLQFAPHISFVNYNHELPEYDEGAMIVFEDTYEIVELIHFLQELKKNCEYGYFGKFVNLE